MDDEMMDLSLVLPEEYTFTPIRALRVTSRKKLAQFLNLEGNLMVCYNDDEEIDIVNNYNGLAELVHFGYLEIQNMARCKSPTEEFLNLWTSANEGGPTAPATVGNLWKFLYTMERFDVLKDCRRAICNDCRLFEENQQMEIEAANYNIEQDPTVSNSDMKVNEFMYPDLTTVKTGVSVQYDAFICYTFEDADDLKFVRKKLIDELETKRGLKLFVPGRDDLPGSAYHVITAYMIEKRCKRVVVVISKSFLKSAACDFQLRFAHSLAPGARSKKLIPVLRDRKTPIPRILRFLAMCDFSKTDMDDWVMDRLYSAIIAPIGPETYYDDDMDESFNSEAYFQSQGMTYPKTLWSPFSSTQSSGIGMSATPRPAEASSSGISSDLPSSYSSDVSMSPSTSSPITKVYDETVTERFCIDSLEDTHSYSMSLGTQCDNDSLYTTANGDPSVIYKRDEHRRSQSSLSASGSPSSHSSISQFFPSAVYTQRQDRVPSPAKQNQASTPKIQKEGKERNGGNSITNMISHFVSSKPKKSKNSSKEGARGYHSEVLNRDIPGSGNSVRKYNSGIVSDETIQMTNYPPDRPTSNELFDASVTSSSEFVKVEMDSEGYISVPPTINEYVPVRKPKPKIPPKPNIEPRRSRSPHDYDGSGHDSKGQIFV